MNLLMPERHQRDYEHNKDGDREGNGWLNKETLTSMEPTVMVVNPIVSRTLNFSR